VGSAAVPIDATGLTILPGVIDTQVHFREPGLEHKEDLESGSRAAVLGGVTALFEMPNTNPLTDTVEALDDKLARARGRMWCDHAFYAGATAANADTCAELEALPGCSGINVFMGASTGNLLVPDDETLARVLASGRRRVAIHAEDEPRMQDRHGFRVPGDPSSHPVWRDDESAILATREVTPQHLTLAGEDAYPRLGTFAQMNPPIRSAAHRDGIWYWLGQGVPDVVGSDHASHTLEEKARPYPDSPFGMPGVQTLLPLLLHHMAEKRLTLARLVDLTSAGAQRLFNLAGKGRIAAGYDADLSIADLKGQFTIMKDWLASRCGWSPFEGMTLKGRKVVWESELPGVPIGAPIRFQDVMRERP
jgi:dihydroorotase